MRNTVTMGTISRAILNNSMGSSGQVVLQGFASPRLTCIGFAQMHEKKSTLEKCKRQLHWVFISSQSEWLSSNGGEDVEWGNPYKLFLGIGAATMRSVWKFSKNQKELLYETNTPVFDHDHQSNQSKASQYRATCTPVCIMGLFTTKS